MRGPKLSTSYRDDGEVGCPVPVVTLLAVGVWHAAKTPTIAQTKYPLRQLSITLMSEKVRLLLRQAQVGTLLPTAL
jgi:hypothetical protein